METKSKRKKRGVNVEVSIQAHQAMVKKSVKYNPRKSLRAQINEFNNLPKDL